MSAADKKDEHDHSPWQETERASRAWGILLFGLIGAAATTFAVCQLRRTADLIYTQLKKSESSSSWRNATSGSNRDGSREEAWKRYNHRIQEEYEEKMKRVERIRRMQSFFNREKHRYKRGYERWRDHGPGAYQHIPHDDWYWQTHTSYGDQSTNYRSAPQASGSYSMSHHYSVLGLDWSRAKLYSDAEIKTAFRAKAMKYHPDQNQDNKEAAEEKFKEVMRSYEAIKQERKKGIY